MAKLALTLSGLFFLLVTASVASHPDSGRSLLRSFSIALSRLLSSSQKLSVSDAAPVCASLACPPYLTVHSEPHFEIRQYREAVWVETESLGLSSFEKAGVAGFHRLFEYIQGRNEDAQHIPMTAPVVTALKPHLGPFHSPAFTVRFFLPPEFAKKPPEPSKGLGLSIVKLPARCVAVRSFPGYATDSNIMEETRLLEDSLMATVWANVTGLDESFAIAQYNSPFELLHRVNEVWVAFEGEEGCVPSRGGRGHLSQ